MPTKIEWCDETLNPITGCTPISPGCQNCYAKTMIETRFTNSPGYDKNDPFKVTFHPERLNSLLNRSKPQRIFMVSMGDMFHKDVPDAWINKIFQAMILASQHQYLILTKRPERMYSYCSNFYERHKIFPKSVWIGVTAEDQQRADERLPLLLKTPAYHHFVSVEPMLGPVQLTFNGRYKLDWVIVGGEKSRENARYMNPDWARNVREQCVTNQTAFFFKQMTNKALTPLDLMIQEFPVGLK